MAAKKDAATRKAPAAPAATRTSATPAQAAPPLTNKGSARGGTSHKSAEAIAQRAYELWQKRGAPHGSDQEDWLAAERELDGGSRH